MSKVILLLAAMLGANISQATELNALQLQQYCKSLKKADQGLDFNEEHIEHCLGYMQGFFDSMIILEQLTDKYYFCPPKSLHRTSNTDILDKWIARNSKIAHTTTASVALFSGFKMAFPCN